MDNLYQDQYQHEQQQAEERERQRRREEAEQVRRSAYSSFWQMYDGPDDGHDEDPDNGLYDEVPERDADLTTP